MPSDPAASRPSAFARFFDDLLQDLRYGARSLRKSPSFTLMAVLTLALGVGANTATFSVVRGVLLRPLPYPHPERLVAAWETSSAGRPMAAAWSNFADWRREATTFEALAAYQSYSGTVLGGELPTVARLAPVSEGFFRVMGVAPRHGRVPGADEHRLGASAVALVSEGFWQTQLGGGTLPVLDVEGHPVQVIGVMPRGFDFPAGTQLWYPLELDEPATDRTAHNFKVVGRIAADSTVARSGEELQRLTEAIVSLYPKDTYLAVGAQVRPLGEQIAGTVKRPLWILFSAASLVLLVACSNLASGFLARGTARRQEVAVRRSLGAATGRLLRQLTTEALLVAGLGAAAGLLVASVLLDALAALAPIALPRMAEVRLDGVVLAFTLAVAVLTALAFGLLPGLKVARSSSLGAGSGARTAGERASLRTWRVLTAAQVALVLMLLAGSGLLLRSLSNVLAVKLGFEPRGVLTADVQLPASRFGDPARVVGFYDEVLSRLATTPGVAGAGLITDLPLTDDSNGRIEVEGGPAPNLDASYRVVSSGYFAAMGIPVLEGRLFESGDHARAEHVAVVNRALAEQAWPGQDPIGKRVTGGGMDSFWKERTWARVIGVVGDVRHRSPTAPFQPEVYFSYAQRPDRPSFGATLVAKSMGEPRGLESSLREVVRQADAQVPLTLRTMDERLRLSVADRRFALVLLGAFALVALALGCVGIWGVVSYTVARRRRELGIRLALGSTPGAARDLVIRQSMTAVALGLAAGLAATLATARLLGNLLFEVAPADPGTLAAVVALLAGAAFLATYLPARRATHIPSMEVIRGE